MDYGPREVIGAFRAGMIDKVVKSNTIWLCTSCYYCTVRCPAGIKITDLMYELKRLGMKYDLAAEQQQEPGHDQVLHRQRAQARPQPRGRAHRPSSS